MASASAIFYPGQVYAIHCFDRQISFKSFVYYSFNQNVNDGEQIGFYQTIANKKQEVQSNTNIVLCICGPIYVGWLLTDRICWIKMKQYGQNPKIDRPQTDNKNLINKLWGQLPENWSFYPKIPANCGDKITMNRFDHRQDRTAVYLIER